MKDMRQMRITNGAWTIITDVRHKESIRLGRSVSYAEIVDKILLKQIESDANEYSYKLFKEITKPLPNDATDTKTTTN